MQSIVRPYSPSRPLHVLHVIGLVGVGKTRFLHEYFPTLPVFNIRVVYQENLFSSTNLKCNTMIYLQYEMVIQTAWNIFLRDHDPREDIRANFCVGVESSGINQTLNVILVSFFPTVLFIHGDPSSLSDETFWVTRPYGPALNTELHEKLTTKTIPYTHLYDTTTNTFSSLLPHEFSALSPKLATLVPKPPMLTEKISSPRLTNCPTCGAPFFTSRLFAMHLQCHADLLR